MNFFVKCTVCKVSELRKQEKLKEVDIMFAREELINSILKDVDMKNIYI